MMLNIHTKFGNEKVALNCGIYDKELAQVTHSLCL